MPETELQIRRCRRTDFAAVMRLLATSDRPAPVPERRTLRRFRALVNDLGSDLYVGLVAGEMVALVYVVYTRQLAAAPRASLERLFVDERFRRRGIGSALFERLKERAIRRGCGTLDCSVPPRSALAAGFLERLGLHPQGQIFVAELSPDSASQERDTSSGDRS
jgi:ribosomal protein S18 acetylase RimI-like enzyme